VVSLASKALDFCAASECITGSRGEEAEGLLEMTHPNKPRSSIQRYGLTTKGREVMNKQKRIL
jgi:hypothetical protein